MPLSESSASISTPPTVFLKRTCLSAMVSIPWPNILLLRPKPGLLSIPVSWNRGTQLFGAAEQLDPVGAGRNLELPDIQTPISLGHVHAAILGSKLATVVRLLSWGRWRRLRAGTRARRGLALVRLRGVRAFVMRGGGGPFQTAQPGLGRRGLAGWGRGIVVLHTIVDIPRQPAAEFRGVGEWWLGVLSRGCWRPGLGPWRPSAFLAGGRWAELRLRGRLRAGLGGARGAAATPAGGRPWETNRLWWQLGQRSSSSSIPSLPHILQTWAIEYPPIIEPVVVE